MTIGSLDLLVDTNSGEVLIVKYVRRKKGTLEGLFASGKVHKYSLNEIKEMGLKVIYDVVDYSDEDISSQVPEIQLMKRSKLNKYRAVGVEISDAELRLEPFAKVSHGGRIGKSAIKLVLPVDKETFLKNLESAINQAD